MRRGVIALDRVAGTVVALGLLLAGGAMLAWRYGELPSDRITAGPWSAPTTAEWWPWATGAGGVVAILLGLWWLARHLPRRVGGRFALPGGDRSGRLTADAHSAVDAAAQALARTPGIRDGSGQVVADRGQLVAELTCTIEPTADLDTVHSAAVRTAAELATVVALPTIHTRVRLRVARTDKTTPLPRVS
ncbi:hypothetical protein GCM10029976_099020 [Kribbella albertanoniae]|uniref:Alkaline shock response membrane anchor protein AmaP n=1 Tax=Kribbella albertanoniae TaxID=1266829 RepID=A0A4R4PQF0_9ACTN|nr:hypothetical protein [Kribbella albertanoniae]TDC24349.1 hypothetical protein E1261_26370 [Kribbella albertanoniae]